MPNIPDPKPQESPVLAHREFRLFAGIAGHPRILLVSSARRFRDIAAKQVGASDTVLEIGCSTGETTRVLAEHAKAVLAVDVSDELIAQTAALFRDMAHVTVRKVDARNVPSLVLLMPRPDVIFLDIGGAAQLNSVAFVARQCLRAFSPRLFVIRNAELASFVSMVDTAELPLSEDWPFTPLPTHDESAMRLENLLAVSRSEQAESRVFAARRLRLYDEPRARDRLEELSRDSQPRVQRVARAILDDIARQQR
jgi:SAM-dependent methyltransferase